MKREDLSEAIKLIENNKKNINYQKLTFDDKVSKVSIVGAGMISSPGVTFRMFSALAKQEINIKVISTSEIKISVLIDEEHVQKAVKVLHTEFNLD
jgi:aspartate kinase